MQPGPQVHGEQVQLVFPQPDAGWPQVQPGPQVHGEQVQSALPQPVCCVISVMPPIVSRHPCSGGWRGVTR